MKGLICVYSRITGLLKELKAVSPNLHFCEVFSDRDPNLKNTEIIIGDFDLLAPHLYNLPCSTRWVQGTWAGVDKVLSVMDPNKLLPYIITRFSGNHFGKIMSEYVLYSIINNERQFEIIRANQKTKDWLTNGKIASYRTISDLNIGILGIGHIGSFIGEILHKLGAKIFGYGRRPKLNMGEASYLSSYYNNKVNLPDFLKSCDYLINILPNTSETVGLLNGGILENCKERQAVFINIGRGGIISDSDLITALNNEWLASVILDVFNEEPLPIDSPLWNMPQVTITPHVAGVSRAKDIAVQFKENLDLYSNNQHIPTTIDFARGY